jgi:hypothetical protein
VQLLTPENLPEPLLPTHLGSLFTLPRLSTLPLDPRHQHPSRRARTAIAAPWVSPSPMRLISVRAAAAHIRGTGKVLAKLAGVLQSSILAWRCLVWRCRQWGEGVLGLLPIERGLALGLSA